MLNFDDSKTLFDRQMLYCLIPKLGLGLARNSQYEMVTQMVTQMPETISEIISRNLREVSWNPEIRKNGHEIPKSVVGPSQIPRCSGWSLDRVPYSGVSDLRDALLDLHGLPSRAGFHLGICEGPTTLLGISWPFLRISGFQETSRRFREIISEIVSGIWVTIWVTISY